jgi:hypothetical protein
VTIQNEPNGHSTDIAHKKSTLISMRLYEWLYRLLDEELKKITKPTPLRPAVDLVAGDLVLDDGNGHQDLWLEFIRKNMDVPRPKFPSVVDGYSIHVYWDLTDGKFGFPNRLEERLAALPKTLKRLGITKPVYITEYGVRTPASKPEPAGRGSGQRVEFSSKFAFQHAWFNALAPQCGAAGLVKWVLYRTDLPANYGEWGMIDAPNAPDPRKPFGCSPNYKVTRLLNLAVGRDWMPSGVGRGAGNTVLASKFAGGGNEAVLVLNRGGAAQDVALEGLKGSANYFVYDWNRDGKGVVQKRAAGVRSAAGKTTVTDVNPQAVTVLSTRELKI